MKEEKNAMLGKLYLNFYVRMILIILNNYYYDALIQLKIMI